MTLSVCRCILKICCTCAKSVLLHIEDEGKGCVCVLAGVGEHGKMHDRHRKVFNTSVKAV